MRRSSLLVLVALGACRSEDAGPRWRPGVTFATPREAGPRGLLDRRGLIHAHSVYSHDACDDEPVKDGVRDPVCFDDFRRGLCEAKHDFVMLTDHRESFSATPFTELLLYRDDRGDRLVDRGAGPVASFAACPDGTRALILAGSESGFMPVGLDRHVEEDEAARDAIYGAQTPEAIAALKANGAVVLVAHTEDWTAEQLVELPLDGFEMYNLHANTLRRAGNVLEYVVRLDRGDTDLPDPNLLMLGIFEEDERYLQRWGTALARGARRTTTLGTDCHRNTFPMLAQDGERIDSYRRMMIWFSNHLLVRPEADGSWDDRHLEEALASRRLYGAFEVLGYPRGFDFRAESSAGVTEIGGEVALAAAPKLVVVRPLLEGLDPGAKPPLITLRLLRAVEGGFEEVARAAEGDLEYLPAVPGAYRAEVRMTPHHLAGHLGDMAPALSNGDFVWIYANAIDVGR